MIPVKDDNVVFQSVNVHGAPMRFAIDKQIKNELMWSEFITQFKERTDVDNGWRGEFWGKCMRGACLIYDFYREDEIKRIIDNAVDGILDCADSRGCISSYPAEKQLCGWDLWCRKYIMLGLEYYLSFVCASDRRDKVITALCRHADCIVGTVGADNGKKPIYECTTHWQGINSSSLLEPFVILYKLTKKQTYLDFCGYIINCGMASGFDLYKTARDGRLYPYQYPVTKAYEMMSCFEGILEYYTVTNKREYLDTVIDFAHKVAESDVTVIGSCGCTHELFDNSASRQTYTGYNDIMQETCVTVTWMKLCGKLLVLTNDPFYADQMEKSYYNAYLGAHNYKENKSLGGLPYDSYSPLLPNVRSQKTGGRMVINKEGGVYGCCAAIASLGGVLFSDLSARVDTEAVTLDFFDSMSFSANTPSGNVNIKVITDYPRSGAVKIISDKPAALKIRIPGWCGRFTVSAPYAYDGGYISVLCKNELSVRLETDIKISRVKGYNGDPDSYKYAYVTRGPLLMGLDAEACGKDVDEPFVFTGSPCEDETRKDCKVCVSINTDKGRLRLINYSDCGLYWDNKTRISAFIKLK